MKVFAVIDAEGWLLRTGRCPADRVEAQAKEGETAFEIDERPVNDGSLYRWVDGAFVASPSPDLE